jgi:hypothetical protein
MTYSTRDVYHYFHGYGKYTDNRTVQYTYTNTLDTRTAAVEVVEMVEVVE